LRKELASNNPWDFYLKKGLDHIDAVRQKFQTITDPFAGFRAQWLNVWTTCLRMRDSRSAVGPPGKVIESVVEPLEEFF
jgi:hypothetical protein